jgi:hypothetical protein
VLRDSIGATPRTRSCLRPSAPRSWLYQGTIMLDLSQIHHQGGRQCVLFDRRPKNARPSPSSATCNVGDQVDIVFEEALAISVQPIG